MTEKSLQNISVILSLSLFLFLGSECLARQTEDEVIATLNGNPIYASEVEPKVAFQVYRLRASIHSLLKKETQELVDQKLLAAEAKRRGLTVAELLEKEVDEKVPPFDEKQVDAYLADHPEDAAQGADRRDRIRMYLSQRAVIQKKLDFLASLRKKAKFTFLLEPPERPRTKLDIDGQPWRGNPDASITLVHFVSFSCESCAKSSENIKRLMTEFPGSVKWVHRNLFSIYDEKALTAAEAGESAHKQGKFWDFHDLIFARRGNFELGDIPEIVGQLGISRQQLDKGKRTGRYLLKVKDDIGYAARIGVTGTLVIFVNGLHMGVTFPYEKLKALVEEELAETSR
ncbi:MAG: thioredoxin domain-containing protein [Proteobacteria bacterium]|nr:thioredoxin domain-containing protein [Pseudomonadota bacterium]